MYICCVFVDCRIVKLVFRCLDFVLLCGYGYGEFGVKIGSGFD